MLIAARGGLIERGRVSASISTAMRDGSLLLIAGPGYGKTTALRQGLDGTGSGAAWVRCRDAGSDAGRLLGLIVDAVRWALPGAADALAEQLASAREPIDPQRAAGALERDLASVLVDPLAIVFDDVESLSGVAAMEVVARLLLSDSPLLRVAVAARRRPDIRLARGRASGWITELGPSELVFSGDECAAYMRSAWGREPDPSEVEELLSATGGWPLGVALAASAHTSAGSGPSPQLAHDYFAEEVFAPLQGNLRRTLLQASMAPDLETAEEAGLGPPGGFSAAIDRHGLFVLDGARRRPELHPLFRDFLRARFLANAPKDEQLAVARSIGEALQESGRGIEAVDYHLAAEEWSTAAAAIAREGPGLVRTAADTVSAWIEALPGGQTDRPELQLLAGELAHGQGRFDEAVALCRAAADGFDAARAPAAARFGARFALADVLMAMGDLDHAAALAATLEDGDAPGVLAARATGVVAAAALARAGRFEQARSVFEHALDDPCGRPLVGLRPTFDAYYLELPAGRLDDALVHAREAVAMLEVADPTGRLPYALTYLMAILEERGEDAAALAAADRTRASAQRVGLAGWVGVALAIRAASLRARAGDPGGAEADLGEVPSDWKVWGSWELQATRAALETARGNGEAALAAAELAAREVERRWPYFDRVRCAALLAPTLSSVGHRQRAREIVELTLRERTPGFSTARLHAVLAWLLHDDGDEVGSSAALLAAWSEAGDQMRHVVRREWPRIERPIWVALERGAIDVAAAVGALAGARPGGEALAGFTRHPVAAVRRAALQNIVAAGHPAGVERVPELLRDPDPTVAAAARAAAELLRRDPPALSFRLLGRFEVRRGAWVIDDAEWGRRVAQRVIRLLLCRGGGPVPEDELIDALWPKASLPSARRSAQVAVSAARAVLDPIGAQPSRLVCSERTYRLDLRAGDTVDANQFERAATAALAADAGTRRTALLAATALWAGEPLPEERFSEWATAWRERLIDLHIELLGALGDEHERAGETAEAVDVARRIVELDPLNEAAHRRLMIAFARAGRPGHALRQYLACRRILVTDLGVEPGEETSALQRRVISGETV